MTTSTQIAAGLRGALATPLGGLAASWAFGTVATVNASPPSVNVYMNNNSTGAGASTTNNLPYISDYNPVVNDAVLILVGTAALKSSYIVIGTLAGASSGGGSSGLPIGAIQMFPVTITYPNWLPCDGSSVASHGSFPALVALIGATLPNLANFIPMGAGTIVGLGATAGATTANGLISHSHGGPAHTHTSAAHAHNDSGHSHGHSHGPSIGGQFVVSGTAAGWNVPGNTTLTSDSVTDTDATNASANIGSTTPGATGSASGTTGSAGSGTSFSVLNPVLGVAYFIKGA